MSEGRVTNSELQSEMRAVRAEQKVEHFKTRVIVVISTLLTGGAKVLTVFGVITIPHL